MIFFSSTVSAISVISSACGRREAAVSVLLFLGLCCGDNGDGGGGVRVPAIGGWVLSRVSVRVCLQLASDEQGGM